MLGGQFLFTWQVPSQPWSGLFITAPYKLLWHQDTAPGPGTSWLDPTLLALESLSYCPAVAAVLTAIDRPIFCLVPGYLNPLGGPFFPFLFFLLQTSCSQFSSDRSSDFQLRFLQFSDYCIVATRLWSTCSFNCRYRLDSFLSALHSQLPPTQSDNQDDNHHALLRGCPLPHAGRGLRHRFHHHRHPLYHRRVHHVCSRYLVLGRLGLYRHRHLPSPSPRWSSRPLVHSRLVSRRLPRVALRHLGSDSPPQQRLQVRYMAVSRPHRLSPLRQASRERHRRKNARQIDRDMAPPAHLHRTTPADHPRTERPARQAGSHYGYQAPSILWFCASSSTLPIDFSPFL
ncbi:hypothetical protein V8F06_012016 [Rhypophila decipiens]